MRAVTASATATGRRISTRRRARRPRPGRSTSSTPILADRRDALDAAVAAARAAPLSARKAMLAALLIDDYAESLFVPGPEADDILAFREGLAAGSPALGLIFGLCAMRPDGPRLVTEAVEVPLAEYGGLGVED